MLHRAQAHTIAQRPRARDAGCPRSACGCACGPARFSWTAAWPRASVDELARAHASRPATRKRPVSPPGGKRPERGGRRSQLPAATVEACAADRCYGGARDRRACATLRGGPHEDRRPARARRRPRVVAGVRPHQPALQPTLPRHYPGDRAARTLRARSPSTMGGTPPVDGAGRQAADEVGDLVRCPGPARFPAGLAPAHRPRIALRFAARRRTVVAPRCDERPRIATIPKLAGAYGVPDVETTDEG